MKAKELLNNMGIYCKIEKVKKQYVQKGCTYGAVVKAKDAQNARDILLSERIKIFDILEQ